MPQAPNRVEPPAFTPPTVTADAGAMMAAAGGGSAEVGEVLPDDEPTCGEQAITAERRTVLTRGNVLVVFDRSGSMEIDWGGMPKYQAAGSAFISALAPLKDNLTVGGVFFPTVSNAPAPPASPECASGCDPFNLTHWLPGPGGCCLTATTSSLPACEVSAIESADQINFTTADAFIGALPQQWHVLNATGTPLEAGITRAAQAIGSRTFSDPLLVFVMTDGEPNCNTDQNAVIQQVTDWKAANIKTYVIGLPGAQGAANLLNQMAQAGGTQSYIEPRDPRELESRLRDVISANVRAGFDTCTFQLTPKTELPGKLQVVMTANGQETKYACGLQSAECHASPTGDSVTLEGSLCQTAMSGRLDSLSFVFGCPTVLPPDPEVL